MKARRKVCHTVFEQARFHYSIQIHESSCSHCRYQKICYSLLGVPTGGALIDGVEKKITESSRFKYCPATEQENAHMFSYYRYLS